ncbi:MAG: molybdopterin-guanine dinucleotide biosynthesis protein B [Hyphomicrobiales bacterium]|nr:MAG: molybdopterin-guanine dinucleotide biosynthesis protein B [Hyphomicrobiales bacterium]
MNAIVGPNGVPVIGVTGWKNSGKTTMVVGIVGELTRRGYRVSTVKHAHHAFDVDHEGTDSYRHRGAGAGEVALVSGYRWVLMHENRENEEEPGLGDFLPRFAPCDVVIVEGYKRESYPKLEVRRLEASRNDPLALTDPTVFAIASDHAVDDTDKPVFSLDDIGAITDFIIETFGIKRHDAAH